MDFRPFDVVGTGEMKRYGRDEDGGYVIYDDPLGAKHLLGYGVDKDVSFENELTEAWGIKAHVFDHTIDDTPTVGPNVTYVKEGIGAVDAPPLFSLDNHVKRFVPEGSNFILKMDVEGAEWEVLEKADLSRVSQLIVEFHDLHEDHSDVIEKLNKTFHLVHIHGNNCHNQPWTYIDRVHMMPRYLECTYVRKDLVTVTPSTKKFPTPLDRKCRGDVPELELNFWEPCERPISFVIEKGTDTRILKKIMTREDEIVEKGCTTCKWPRQFYLNKDDIFPYDIIMRLQYIPEKNIVFREIFNFAVQMKSCRYTCQSPDAVEVNEVIYNHSTR
jgi:hypothetical protein